MQLLTSTPQQEIKKKDRCIGRIEHVIVSSIAPGMSATLSTHPEHVWMEPIEFGYGALRKRVGLHKQWKVKYARISNIIFSTLLLF